MKKIATCSAKWRARCVASVRGAKPLAAFEARIARAVAARDGEVLLAAVSGGPDSAALAALLARICEGARCTLVLGHVNHGFRLRRERYAVLLGMAAKSGATRIFTAHHAADQTETVLLALFRGAGPAGLCGMPAVRELEPGVELVRPLLQVEPEALRTYCAALHLPFALDPTNEELEYRRNAPRFSRRSERVPQPRPCASACAPSSSQRPEMRATSRSNASTRRREPSSAARADVISCDAASNWWPVPRKAQHEAVGHDSHHRGDRIR